MVGKKCRDGNPLKYCGIVSTLFGCFYWDSIPIHGTSFLKCFLEFVSVVFWGGETFHAEMCCCKS